MFFMLAFHFIFLELINPDTSMIAPSFNRTILNIHLEQSIFIFQSLILTITIKVLFVKENIILGGNRLSADTQCIHHLMLKILFIM